MLLLSATAWGTSAAQPLPPVSNPTSSGQVEVTRSSGETVYRAAGAHVLSTRLACGASKTIRIVRAPSPTAAAQGSADNAEPTLVMMAQSGSTKLVLIDARCAADGTIVATGIQLEPTSSAPSNPCALPYARQQMASCR